MGVGYLLAITHHHIVLSKLFQKYTNRYGVLYCTPDIIFHFKIKRGFSRGAEKRGCICANVLI